MRLARNNDAWSFEAPLAAKADPALVENTINTLTAAKVVRFIEAEQTDLMLQGLLNPFMQVTIHGNKRRQTLIVGNLDPDSQGAPQYFAKLENNPAIFTVLARPFDDLREAQEALRERNFMNFDPSKLSTINISEDGRKIRLQKLETGENDWQVLESKSENKIQPYRADPAIMDSLLKDLSTLRAIGFTADAPTASDNKGYGFNNPRRIVSLSFSEGDPLKLMLAHPEGREDVLYAKTNLADFIYYVDRQATLRIIPLDTSYYRNRLLDILPAAARISALKLTNLKKNEAIFDYTLDQENVSWNDLIEEYDTKYGDQIRVLLGTIRRFEVKSYLIDSYAEAYPITAEKSVPWLFQLSATIQLPGGETTRTETREYVLTERLSGTVQVAGSKKYNTIFEIPQPLIDALYELTDDMKIPPEMTDAPVLTPKPIEQVPTPTQISAP